MYAAETCDNFRWVTKLLARPPSYTLTSADLASVSLQLELADLGQFAEVAHGDPSLAFVWEHMDALLEPAYPLEGYNALRGSVLHSVFRGSVARLQAYIAYRPETKQLVVAFSGTSSVAQSLRDLDVRLVGYSGEGACAVHAGFWAMYKGVRSDALGALTEALERYTVTEVVFTGHSLGAVMCYLLALDVMREGSREQIHTEATLSPLKLAVFGCPRIGNLALARYWRDLVRTYCSRTSECSVSEYSVQGHNDGVPALPPKLFGYHRFCQKPLYFAHGRLYHVPESMSEYSTFRVQQAEGTSPRTLTHPLGGHLYYNGRDMERLLRRMQWIDLMRSRGQGWKECYNQRLVKGNDSS